MIPVWSPEAIDDLAALRACIEQDNPTAAQRVVLHIIENVETLLPNHPEMGRSGRVPGTRELVIPRTPFIVPYRLVGNTLQILRIYHEARRWPDAFEKPSGRPG
jgi:toxin ParE1/3/4